ncbi:MAG TPA: NTP transferase domain-containing protein [Ignavibacteriales bacterium]|nr:NTP transferase domain-containing protein [Ignavibacteriales bacterium]
MANLIVDNLISQFSSPLNYNINEIAIVLAAGHGKRIKSKTSKMLHRIWGVTTVERVYNACKKAVSDINMVFVVGIKADSVITELGKKPNTTYAFQEEQKGTGHAVQVALEKIDFNLFDGIIYVLPGDMGLLNSETVDLFRKKFINSNYDMIVLTGIYEGDVNENQYGRIIRAKDFDIDGKPCPDLVGNVIQIIEHKDILALPDNQPYIVEYKGHKFSYRKQELIENREFNSGVYAFKSAPLKKLIYYLNTNNAQNEIYITDLIDLFNKNNYTVGAVSPAEQYVLIGFNNKAVLKEMEKIAREKAYNLLKNIIEIEDPDDFFIDETVIEQIIELDKKGMPLDIFIGKGVHIGKGVQLTYNNTFKKNAFLNGNIVLGENVTIYENALLSCYPNQKLIVGNNVEILWGDLIKGNIIIGDNTRIESSVNVTGSDEFPTRIGKNVLIKGTSYIFGSIIEDDIFIEHSVLIKKRVERVVRKNGEVQPVMFYLPTPKGIDVISDL